LKQKYCKGCSNFNKKLESSQVANNFKVFNDLFNFRDQIGSEYNETCLIKNKIEIKK
jgi:hypothetical protein